ncbi:MAG: hypothetical protein WKG07_07820 [Hymenobacter sp.]
MFAAVARGPISGLIEEDHDLRGPVPIWRYYYRARPTGLPPRQAAEAGALALGHAARAAGGTAALGRRAA